MKIISRINHHTKHLRLFFVGMVILIFSLELPGQELGSATDDYPEQIWAAGNDLGIYMVWFRQEGQDQEFQIFYRRNSESIFRGIRRYAGRPVALAADDDRLWVFLGEGVCRSYSPVSGSRTEKQLPDDFEAVDCVIKNGVVYVLVRAINVTAFTMESQTDDPNEVSGAPEKITLVAGDYLILYQGQNQPYQSLTTAPLPMEYWIKPKLVFQADEIHLCGIDHRSSGGDIALGELAQRRWMGDGWSEMKTAPVGRVVDLAALEVNRQIRVVAYVLPEESTENSNAARQAASAQFYLVWPGASDWNIVGPLADKESRPLTAVSYDIAFTQYDEQNLAVLKRDSPEEIYFGLYDATGEAIEPLGLAVSTTAGKKHVWLVWLNAGLILAISGIILYWRRADAFMDRAVLPDYIQLAPLSYRALALFLDILPPFLVTVVLFPEMTAESAGQVSGWDQWQAPLESMSTMPTLIEQVTFIVLITLYMMVCELLLATTPGKMALRLVVLDRSGGALTPKQALIRNLLRFVDLIMGFTALLVFVTVRQQRLGDLAGGTIVVLQTPELVERLNRPSDTEGEEDDKGTRD